MYSGDSMAYSVSSELNNCLSCIFVSLESILKFVILIYIKLYVCEREIPIGFIIQYIFLKYPAWQSLVELLYVCPF